MKKNEIKEYFDNHYSKMTESQKKLTAYIIENYREVAFLSAVELGEKVACSDATVIRFAQILGFEGYADFRKSIQEQLNHQESPDIKLLKSIKNFQNQDGLLSNNCKTDLQNLEEYILNLNMNQINLVVDDLMKAKTIYLVGLGTSSIIVDFLSYHLRRMGFSVTAIREGGLILMDKLASMDEKDLLLIATFPRYSRDSMNAIRMGRKKGAKVVTITDNELTELAAQSNRVLVVKTQNVSYFNSYVVPMELCNVLLIQILEKNKEHVYQKLKANMEQMEEFDLFL